MIILKYTQTISIMADCDNYTENHIFQCRTNNLFKDRYVELEFIRPIDGLNSQYISQDKTKCA